MKFQPPVGSEDVNEWAKFREAYMRHLEQLRGTLPAHVWELAHLEGIEDGLIVEVSHNRAERRLKIILRCGYIQMGYYDLVLIYEDAEISLEHERVLAQLARRTPADGSGYVPELYRFELDVTEDGRIEHRIQFHVDPEPSYLSDWFAIRCRSLHWEKISRPSHIIPALLERFPGGPHGE
jgi:hypothetical protein